MVSSFVGFLSKYECVLKLTFYPRMIRTQILIQTDIKYVFHTHICRQANEGRSISSKLHFHMFQFSPIIQGKKKELVNLGSFSEFQGGNGCVGFFL